MGLLLLGSRCLLAQESVAHDSVVSGGTVSAIATPSLNGSWTGSWNSHTTGHQGPLSASIRPAADGTYQANFQGKFFKVIPFRYQMRLQVVASGDGFVELAGSKKLGPLMGYYSYRAVVQGDSFQATYNTKRDRGTFQMRRR
jgi:hypothetical protein